MKWGDEILIAQELACIEHELEQILKEAHNIYQTESIWNTQLRAMHVTWQTTATFIDKSTMARAWLAYAAQEDDEI